MSKKIDEEQNVSATIGEGFVTSSYETLNGVDTCYEIAISSVTDFENKVLNEYIVVYNQLEEIVDLQYRSEEGIYYFYKDGGFKSGFTYSVELLSDSLIFVDDRFSGKRSMSFTVSAPETVEVEERKDIRVIENFPLVLYQPDTTLIVNASEDYGIKVGEIVKFAVFFYEFKVQRVFVALSVEKMDNGKEQMQFREAAIKEIYDKINISTATPITADNTYVRYRNDPIPEDISDDKVTETGYEFTTAQAFTPVSVKLENGYGKTATAALTDTEIRFASDSFATGTYEFTQSVTQNQQWNAFDNGGLVTVTDEDGIDLQLGVQGNGGNFGIFFLPTNGVGWPTAIPANGFCVFFTNADGNRLCPEVYMNYQGNGWLQLTTTSDPNDGSFPKIDPAAPGSSDWTNMKFSLKKVGGEWGIYLNDVLVPFKGHSQLAGTPYAEHIGKSFNPLAVAFPDAEWRNAEGKTNFGVSGWAGDNAVKFYVPRVGVTAAVTDLYGAAEKYAAMKACDAQGREVSLLGGNLTETGLEYISYDVGRIAKLTLETAGGVKSEFAVDYASKTADERVTLGSAETTYDKTLTVKDKDGATVAGASLTVKDGETDVTGYIKTIDNGDGTYTIKGINKSLTVTAEKGGANGTVALDKESAEKEVPIYKEYSLNITLKSGTGALLENMQDALSVYTDENKENASVIYDAESKVYVISGLYETNGVKTVRFSAEGYVPAKTTVTSASVSAALTAVRLYSTQVTLAYTYGEGEGKRTVAIAGAEDYLKVYDSATASQPAEGFAVTYAEGVYTVSGIREDSAEAKFIKFEMENYGVRTASVTFDTAAQGVSMTTTHTYSAVIEVLDDNGGVIEDAVIITDADGDFVYDEETKAYILGGQTDVVEATVTAAGYSGRTVSLNPETQKVTVTLADTSALKAAIDAAKAAKQNVAVSVDGSEIDVSQKWTTKAGLDALNAAIEAAEGVYADAAADKDALAAARTALDTAVTAFNAEVKDGTKAEVPVDKTALEAAIDAAENAKKSAVVSADGKDVEPDKKWTTQQAMDALTADVDTAKTAAAKEDAAQAEIDAAKAALEKAVADFNAGLKNGTKTAEGSSSEGSSSTSESGGCGSSIAVGGMLAAAVVCGAALLLKRRRG